MRAMTAAGSPGGMVVVLTIHGIGFQQPPVPPRLPGYADALHANLRRELDDLLGDDPERTSKGEHGPVYVASDVDGDVERGLDRIAVTDADGRLDWSARALAPAGCRVAHVALVYAGLESTRPHLGVGLRALLSALVHLGRYAGPGTTWRMWRQDGAAILPSEAKEKTPAETQVRRDIPRKNLVGRQRRDQDDDKRPPRTTDLLVQLEDDVAMYVYSRRTRDRLQDFVNAAVQRLLARDDVVRLVVNAHSQGSVVAFDTLQPMSTHQLDRVGAFVTAGSPLRKYVDFFNKSRDLAGAGEVPWLNFWDRCDPVADPLAPPVEWRPLTDATVHPGQFGLFRRRRGGGFVALAHVVDRPVDNVKDSAGGGMQAHNYWENQHFVHQLGQVIRGLI
jgi:hypothetical protein